MELNDDHWTAWTELAWQARKRAYAPYSGFAVGAVVVSAEGMPFAGCNVENLSFGLTMCAERVAVGNLVASLGRVELVAVVVVADTEAPVSPCGACRQVLAEFGRPMIRLVGRGGRWEQFSMEQLLPRPSTGILGRE